MKLRIVATLVLALPFAAMAADRQVAHYAAHWSYEGEGDPAQWGDAGQGVRKLRYRQTIVAD